MGPITVIVAVLALLQKVTTPARVDNSTSPLSHTTSLSVDVKYDVIGPDGGDVTSSLHTGGCVLLPENDTFAATLQRYLAEGSKLIKYNVYIRSQSLDSVMNSSVRMYRPGHWVRSTGRHGTGLLFLRPEFDILSLATLSHGVQTTGINFVDEPASCSRLLSEDELERQIRIILLHDFKNSSSESYEKFDAEEQVCNMHVLENGGVAEFHYYCCHRKEDKQISCYYLKPDIWRNILFVVIVILKVFVILFSPLLVPGNMYRLKKMAMQYTHRLDSGNEYKMKALVTTNPDRYGAVNCTKVKFRRLRSLSKFCESIQGMSPNVLHTFTINDIKFRASFGRLIPEDYAPVGIFGVLYSELIKCNMRKKQSVKPCCDASIFCNSTTKRCPWYTVLKRFMRSMLFLLIATPWILRLYVFFEIETEEISRRKEEASERNLNFYFPGNFTLYLTPLHVIFVIIYILLVLESFTYSSMSKHAKEKMKFVLRKCFQDMRDTNQLEVIGWLVRLILKPCEKFGLLGLLIGPVVFVLCLPFLICVLAFYMLPTINITSRLLAHFFVYLFPKEFCKNTRLSQLLQKAENNLEMATLVSMETLEKDARVLSSRRRRLQQLVIIIMCLVSLYSIIFLFTEFIAFFVEIIVYTIMGLILNASATLSYVSFVLLLGVYARDCFGNVAKNFLEFNKTLHDFVLENGKENMRKALWSIGHLSENIAFRISSELCDQQDPVVGLCTNADGHLRWRIKNLLLFIGNKQVPMIPVNFFHDACVMPYYRVPGRLLHGYIFATLQFCSIIVFLFFVLLVVMAFGDTYEISATNQVIATLAGGFIPFALKNFIFRSLKVNLVETENIYFRSTISHVMDTFQQKWPVDDIDALPVRLQRPVSTELDLRATVADIGNVSMSDTQTAASEEDPILVNGSGSLAQTPAHDLADLDLLVIATEKELQELPSSGRTSRTGSSGTGSSGRMEPQEMKTFSNGTPA